MTLVIPYHRDTSCCS